MSLAKIRAVSACYPDCRSRTIEQSVSAAPCTRGSANVKGILYFINFTWKYLERIQNFHGIRGGYDPCIRLLGGWCVAQESGSVPAGFRRAGQRPKNMRRTKAQAWDTRTTILNAAEAVFFSHGVTPTTLDEIAGAAGVTRGAIYGHFRNKDAVLEGIFERFALPLDPFAIALPEDDPDPLGQLQAELEARLSLALCDKKTRHLYSIVFARCEATEDTAFFCRRVRMASRLAEAQIERALRHAISRKQLSPQLNVNEAALFIHATLTGILRKDLLRRRHNARLDLGRIVGMTLQCLTPH